MTWLCSFPPITWCEMVVIVVVRWWWDKGSGVELVIVMEKIVVV